MSNVFVHKKSQTEVWLRLPTQSKGDTLQGEWAKRLGLTT